MAQAATWRADQVICLDESASNERTGDRKFGWSPIGVACQTSRPVRCLGWWSISPALTGDGYLDWVIFQGGINKEIFLTFVHEKVLPYCNPWPGPCSIIVLDNASIHRDQELQDMHNAAGVKLHFLLPYSPNFNPIELTFKDLKAWIKWYWWLMGDFQRFEAFLHFALKQNQGVHAKAHYELSSSGHNTVYILLAKYAGKKLVEALFCYTISTLFMPSAQFFTTGNMNNMDEATKGSRLQHA